MAHTYFQKGQNFSPHEKLILVDLVARHGHDIVQRKSNDNSSLVEKDRVWREIYLGYNRHHDVTMKRSEKQLKLLWKNLKAKCKREFYRKVAARHEVGAFTGREDALGRTPPPGSDVPLTNMSDDVLRKVERLLKLEQTVGEKYEPFADCTPNTTGPDSTAQVRVEVWNHPENDVIHEQPTRTFYDEGWRLDGEPRKSLKQESDPGDTYLPQKTPSDIVTTVDQTSQNYQMPSTSGPRNHVFERVSENEGVDVSEEEDNCPQATEPCRVSAVKGQTASKQPINEGVVARVSASVSHLGSAGKEVDHQRQMLKLAKQEHDVKMMTMRMKRRQTMQINRREHLARMENYKLEKEILQLKKRKLELEIKNGLYMDDDDDLGA